MPIKEVLGLPAQLQGLYSAVKPRQYDGRDYVTCPYDDVIGIEIEVENVSDDVADRNAPQGWSQTDDGSLRNSGREYISKPTIASTVHWSLYRLLDKHLNNEDQSFSPRTSVHVHVNCRDLEVDDVKNIIRYYAIFERLLYRFCGKSRYKNIYCVPLVDTSLMEKLPSAFPNTGRWPKYAGLNAAPLTTQGTLEFRHMHGTFDVDKLMVWINLILSIVNYVKGKPAKLLQDELAACCDERQFLELMDRVFTNYRRHLNYKNADDYTHCYKNMLMSYGSQAVRTSAKSALSERIKQCAAL